MSAAKISQSTPSVLQNPPSGDIGFERHLGSTTRLSIDGARAESVKGNPNGYTSAEEAFVAARGLSEGPNEPALAVVQLAEDQRFYLLAMKTWGGKDTGPGYHFEGRHPWIRFDLLDGEVPRGAAAKLIALVDGNSIVERSGLNTTLWSHAATSLMKRSAQLDHWMGNHPATDKAVDAITAPLLSALVGVGKALFNRHPPMNL